jgi:hypothetical protein
MADTVNLVLYPEVQEGENVEEVKAKLCKTLSVDDATAESWYATENPTAILKDVDEATAAKYVEAIQKCGAQCNLQPSGEDKSNWSLEKMTQADFKDLFICPSCEHEENVGRGNKVEQCPNCGLIIAKWEEKIQEEAEKEKIRRRLQREQRHKGDRESDLEAKRRELERLRAQIIELMKELGMRPPGRVWLFFEKYTISMSLAISAVIIMLTGIAFHYVDQYLDQLAYEELVAAPPSEQIQRIASTVATAVEMQQTGNSAVMTEMADAARILRGDSGAARQEMAHAAAQIMKGVEGDKFIAAATRMSLPATIAKVAEGEAEPVRINTDTIGGVSGLRGVAEFEAKSLNQMAPPLLEHGHEEVLTILTEKRIIKDVLDPEGPDLVVDAIDEMDGSEIVTLMAGIARDQEWDQFLLSHVKKYIINGEIESAEKLSDRIKNPVVRIQSFGEIMVEQLIRENAAAVKVLYTRVRLNLDKIEDADTRARAVLALGELLAAAGSESEPMVAMDKVTGLIADAESPLEEASLTSRLAVSYMRNGDRPQAKRMLQNAMRVSGRIPDLKDRISAFTRIARRYYDVHNGTLANEILAEATLLAAARLEQVPRSESFGEIALARAYIGDASGARQAINNAAEGEARQQLIAKIAESLIGEKRYYEALAWMETLENEVEYARLELRLSSALLYEGRSGEALNRIDQSAARMQRIYELSERGLLTSQYARFYARLGMQDRANQLFAESEGISAQLSGRKSQVNLAIVALDRARVFQLEQAKRMVIEELTDTVVKDPIDAEVLSTERIVKNLLPEGL